MEKDIGKINKNDTSDIVVRIDDFGGNRGLTIREFVTSERYTGFTKAGVRILSRDFPKLKEMINSITDEDMSDEVSEPKEQLAPGQETLSEPKDSEEVQVEKPGEAKEGLPDY